MGLTSLNEAELHLMGNSGEYTPSFRYKFFLAVGSNDLTHIVQYQTPFATCLYF